MIDSISDFLGQILIFFYQVTGNYAYSIILFAVAIKLALLYFTHQQYESMKKMQLVQPEMKKLQDKYKGNPELLNQKMMELWKTHNVNPLGGCFPLLIQMPIIYALYRTIENFKVEFTHAKFLWIGSMPEANIPVIPFNIPLLGSNIPLFGTSLFSPDLPLVIIYGLSMYLSQIMTFTATPQAGNQKSMAIFMSVMITFIMFKFQSALILYWLVFNLLSVIQQVIMMKFVSRENTIVQVETEDNEETIENVKEADDVQNVKKKKKKKK